jgi:hypothetical protein
MLLDELLIELEQYRGEGYCICFDGEGKGISKFKDIDNIEIDENAGVIHLKSDENE